MTERKPQRPAGPPMRGPLGMGMGPPQKAKDFRASARRLLGLLAPERRPIELVIALALASVSLSVAGPRLLGHATDLIFGAFMARRGLEFDALARVLGLVVALYAGASLLMFLQGRLLNTIVQRTIRTLRADVDAKLMRVPLGYFDRQPHGEVLSRVTNDIDNVAMGLQQTLGQILIALATALGILIMLVVISPPLALIALVTVPLSVFVTAKIGKRAQAGFAAQWKHVGALNGQIEEAFTGHTLVKVFGRTTEFERRFSAKNQELFEAGFRAQFVSSLIMPAITFVGNLTYIAIAVLGGLRVAARTMLLGSVQAFIQYSRQFTQNLSQLAQVATVLQSGVASAERVFELLDEPDESPERNDAALPEPLRGEVRFESVGFRYQPEVPLIERLSLVASPGQTVAIVGPTGAGKTTLVNLLMRFYDLDAGAIRVDGVDIASVPRGALRSRFGMVLQDTWLFSGTIRDNIRYGNPGASEDELQAAARATYVDRFVRALPAGYDTVIDEESSNLSAGEKQLITIARACLADPAILILDEATSSVDTRTEVLVQHAMATLRHRRTSFVIAHRLSTIRDADLILVMEHGAIVEQGTHEQLLAAGGPFHALYHAQFSLPLAS